MSRTPLDWRILIAAVPAAPTPVTTTRIRRRSFFTIRSALSSAARTTTAVPCWSSWNTGMSSSLRRRSSTSKQRGAAISSRLMPPKAGAMSLTDIAAPRCFDVEERLRKELEAAGCGDILEVDAAEGRGDELDGLDDFVDILRREADREGVHAPELLEQHRLAFHHRERRLRPNIAQAEHRRTVGDHGDHVLLDRQRERARSIVADRQADPGDPRRVHHREVVTGADRHFVAHLDLSPAVHQEGPVGDVADADTGDVAEPGDDLLGVDAVASLDGDVALRPAARGLDEVDRPDVPLRLTDGGRDAAQHARTVGDLQTDREAVRGARRLHSPASTL